jgi:hypothetical protein
MTQNQSRGKAFENPTGTPAGNPANASTDDEARPGAWITAAARLEDGPEKVSLANQAWEQVKLLSTHTAELAIDPLSEGWDTPIKPGHFRSGCAPIQALAHARSLIQSRSVEAVIIRGRDFIRSEYENDKALRNRLMAIYAESCPIPEAYTRLARAFCLLHGISEPTFKKLAALLYENYVQTAKADGRYAEPKPAAFEMVTDLFRAVDCANPVVDFQAAVVVVSDGLLRQLSLADRPIRVVSVGLGSTAGDGPGHVQEISRYAHLKSACDQACKEARIDLRQEFQSGQLLLEAYTCFPVVPLAFLLASGICPNVNELEAAITSRPLTVTGGMNIARAAWNNPALNGLVVMAEKMRKTGTRLGAVHGNGGLGYRQGLALLELADR